MELAADTSSKSPLRNYKRAPKKTQPLSRSNIDGRTNAAKHFDRIVIGIQNDLGGADQCSTVELELIDAFAGASVLVKDMTTRLLIGAQVSIDELTQSISSMVRVATRLGLGRRSKDISPPTLGDIARDIEAADDE